MILEEVASENGCIMFFGESEDLGIGEIDFGHKSISNFAPIGGFAMRS
jgi:hypothetical protein